MVIADCNGRHKERAYYADFAKALSKLSKDTVAMTASAPNLAI